MTIPKFALSAILAVIFTLPWSPDVRAQEADAVSIPQADPADVESIDAIVAAVYDVISGPAGPRDWDRFRSLFAPQATLAPAAPGPDGATRLRVLEIEEYVDFASRVFQQRPFYEVESGRTTERFGNVASLMSGYESRTDPADDEPFQRGINAFTLIHDGQRWHVLSIAWDVDRPGNPMPEAYR